MKKKNVPENKKVEIDILEICKKRLSIRWWEYVIMGAMISGMFVLAVVLEKFLGG